MAENPTSVWGRRDPGSVPGWGRSPGEGDGNLLQYSCLGNPMDSGTWRATVHGTWLGTLFGCSRTYWGARDLHCSIPTLSCGMLGPVPLPGIEPWSPALGAQSLSHWTTGKPFRIRLLIIILQLYWIWLIYHNSPIENTYFMIFRIVKLTPQSNFRTYSSFPKKPYTY